MSTETEGLTDSVVIRPPEPVAPRGIDAFPAEKNAPWQVPSESQWEARAGVIALEEIHQQRASILPRLRALRARYGPGGTFDAQRKAYRAAIALSLLAGPPPAGSKTWSDERLENAASADDRYRAWLDNAELERADLTSLEVTLTHLEEAYNRGQGELRLAQSEWNHTGSQT